MNTYNGTNSALSASVVFDYLSNGTLAVTLSNTALNGIKDPSDVLTSVFWDYAGSPLNLSFLSATAPTTFNASGTIGTNVDLKAINEWKYESITSATGLGGDMTSGGTAVSQKYGLGTAGLGIFQGGGGQQFNYGVISGYSSNANNPVKTGTFVKDSATFLFSGLTSSFDITKIGNVRFQYGTNLAEAYIVPKPKEPKRKVPEPGVNAALAFMAVGGLIKLNKKTTKILKQLS
ncbi:MAG: PEP-CTERM sorting domain-containing protein [Calothrix sp. FI2-JRJ7]|nr:PEP-CTERM sorting domain-containing protein [Calothrix sp. FI2-JRJ7]